MSICQYFLKIFVTKNEFIVIYDKIYLLDLSVMH